MEILGLQKLTLLDYPGKVACTIFLGGCNFRCPFCHNGNLVSGEGAEAFSKEEVFAFLKKRKNVLDGVCVTGGEPLLNDDIYGFLKEIKEMGYKVKLDTNGSFPEKLKRAIFEGCVDYIAMDIKNSKAQYAETVGKTGFDIAPVSESVRFLMESGVEYEFRTTVVAEFHESECMKNIAEWIHGAKRYFLQGYVDSENVIKKGLHAVSEEKMREFAEIFKEHVGYVGIRGIEV